MTFFSNLLQNGSGFVFQTLLTDLLVLGVIAYLISAVIMPMIKPIITFRHVAKQIGGLKGHWLCGDVLEHGFNHKGRINCVAKISEFPAIRAHYTLLWGVVLVYHPDVIKKVISGSYPKPFYYTKLFGDTFQNGLVTSAGDLWKRHRKLLTPVFHYEILKEYNKTFNKNRYVFLNACEAFSQTGKACNITESISDMTYANMMECVMSQSPENDPRIKRLINAIRLLQTNAMQRTQYAFFGGYWLLNLTGHGRIYNEGKEIFYDIIWKLIKQRQELVASQNFLNNMSEDSTFKDEETGKTLVFRKHKGKKFDFLDILVQAKDQDGKGLNDDEIFNEVATFFAAGQDTTASALNWILYNLSINQDCQDRCREEIIEVLGQKEECNDSDLAKLTYLTQCIKEGMRLRPTIHVIARMLTEDLTLSHRFNNYKEIKLPKGTNVAINILALHRNPHVWENPEVYDPERFTPENLKKMSPFAYLPFAAGPRNCIGQRFAMNQMKIVLAHTLRSYKFFYDSNMPEPRMDVGVTISPENGLELIVKRVEE